MVSELINFKPRLYQETIFHTTVKNNTLVVLPTGLGKTNIFLMLAAQRLSQYPQSKIVFLAPTKPLVEQHLQSFKRDLKIEEDKLALFTGQVSPKKRKRIFQESQIIFSTPQSFENDVISGKIDISKVSLLGIDEAHRAVGDYSYVFLAKQYQKKARFPRILALTASPGSKMEKIKEVCQNLFIEEVEARTFDDPDVKPYIKPIKTNWIEVDLPDSFSQVKKYLDNCYKSKLKKIKKFGHLNSIQMNKKDLLSLQGQLHAQIAQGEKDFSILKSISLLAEAMKVEHARQLLETQGIQPLYKYLQKLEKESTTSKVKAVKNLVKDINFKSALIKTQTLVKKDTLHPKLEKLKEIIKKEIKDDIKIIIFTQFRDSALDILSQIKTINKAKPKLFVGQAKKGDTGLSQKEQKEILNKFKKNNYNILVCTSVAEEGLDIPAVDLVLFYEPIPSAIRHIQRRGRTGRQEKGRVIILVTKNTRDVGYRWSAHHKEKKMSRILQKIKKEFHLQEQPTLSKFIPDKQQVQIIADYREKGSPVLKKLIDLGVNIELKQMSSSDYLCSGQVAVEYKTRKDFVDSIIDGRLLDQLKELKKNYSHPLVIIEGEKDIYSFRKIHPNAIRGMLAAITVSYNIPLLYTKNAQETASLLSIIAKREQDKEREYNPHTSKKNYSLKEQQEYLISSLPKVGPKVAQDLLEHFSTIKKIANASLKELKQVEGVGPQIAQQIKTVFNKKYEKE